MWEFLTASQNAPFSAALAVMLLVTLLEVGGMILGATLSDMIDSILPDLDMDADVDLDVDLGADINADIDADLDTDFSGGSTPTNLIHLLGWLSIGKVPVMILVMVFLTVFGLTGLLLQNFVYGTVGIFMPSLIASIPAFVAGLFGMRYGGKGLAHVIPKDETSAVSENSFVGLIATIVLGTASNGNPAQAKLSDSFDQTHYIMIEPDNVGEAFPQGSKILVVRKNKNMFYGIHPNSPGLSDAATYENAHNKKGN